MLEEIEEYDADKNEWTIITLRNPSVWNPVEVCAVIQVSEEQILIFGGSDVRVRDSSSCYLFSVSDYSFDRLNDLKKAQVFVSTPFLYGDNVYAVGNEYYVKSRNLHRFNTITKTWNIIF